MSSESDNELLHTPDPLLTKEEKRRIQLRQAQRRYYDAHKRKEKEAVPVSYQPEHIRTYHKTYYEKNKEVLNARAKERYNKRKQERQAQIQQDVQQAVQNIPNMPPTEPVQSIPLILPSQPILADFERITYNC